MVSGLGFAVGLRGEIGKVTLEDFRREKNMSDLNEDFSFLNSNKMLTRERNSQTKLQILMYKPQFIGLLMTATLPKFQCTAE